MADMPAGIAADISDLEPSTSGATTPPRGRQSPSRRNTKRKDTILSLVELLLKQEENRERSAYLLLSGA
jgi:hypothetical protein